jgi:hypothetical protein
VSKDFTSILPYDHGMTFNSTPSAFFQKFTGVHYVMGPINDLLVKETVVRTNFIIWVIYLTHYGLLYLQIT